MDKMTNQTFSVDLDLAVDLYSDMVLRIAMSYTKNMADAQDVYQETFLRLVRYRDTIESEEHLKAWLIRVATNCAKSLLTNAWNKNTQGLEENTLTDAVYEQPETGEVYEEILKLPEKYKTPLFLYYYEGYSVNQIAIILEMKENTVKSLLSRGRSKLKKALEKGGYN